MLYLMQTIHDPCPPVRKGDALHISLQAVRIGDDTKEPVTITVIGRRNGFDLLRLLSMGRSLREADRVTVIAYGEDTPEGRQLGERFTEYRAKLAHDELAEQAEAAGRRG